MPFGKAYEGFGQFSLSTKMVTYAGSGIPILYHGPMSTAAYDLLRRNAAAIFATSLIPEEVAKTLEGLTSDKRREVTSNALTVAKRHFMLEDQVREFWGTVSKAIIPERFA